MIVSVVGSTTTSKTFDLADLARLHDAAADDDYILRGDDGRTSDQIVGGGTLLRDLVSDIADPDHPGSQLDPDATSFTEVFDAGDRSHPLQAGDLGAVGSNGFTQGGPVIYGVSGDQLGYIRPLRGDDDVNLSQDPQVGGFFQTDPGGALRITVHASGQLLAPVIHVSPDPRKGSPVELSATVDNPSGTGLTYDWDFGDRSGHGAGASVAHTWASSFASDYATVALVVTGADGSSGSTYARVTFGGPTEPPTETPTTTPSTTTPSASATGTATPTATPTATSSGTPDADQTEGTSGRSGGSPATGHSAGPTAGPTSTSSTTPHATPSDAGVAVDGLVLLSAGQQPEAVAPVQQPPPGSVQAPEAERVTDHHPLTLPGWLVAAAVGATLLVLGGLREARPGWWRRLRPPARMH
ncbi:hypothetical protein ASC77_17060 [Nocardioides sp. Root1257]|uniref:PKD domain-containing protein n=1 Tax=unclassified Nocardioides TaxID=2615069 RepID=UPI0006F298F8|nr:MULTISPECIES: PKD domain-containing protein [unclassified Nocardioides]KQW46909.1 hypothetical protein ASC77_17060 [Nocardioides sp. Root1257]KRC43656.1 hypothetical protein ASE24_18015 [Nocardioides sp. Root224]